jgi:hypothetical protein
LVLLLDECVEGDVYGFGVKNIEITEVAEMAEIPKRVQGIWMTARHVIQAEVFIKTARHVI